MKENYGCIDKFITHPFRILFKESFLTAHSESSSVPTRMQIQKPNRTESLSSSCSWSPGDRLVDKPFQRNPKAVFGSNWVMHE